MCSTIHHDTTKVQNITNSYQCPILFLVGLFHWFLCFYLYFFLLFHKHCCLHIFLPHFFFYFCMRSESGLLRKYLQACIIILTAWFISHPYRLQYYLCCKKCILAQLYHKYILTLGKIGRQVMQVSIIHTHLGCVSFYNIRIGLPLICDGHNCDSLTKCIAEMAKHLQ